MLVKEARGDATRTAGGEPARGRAMPVRTAPRATQVSREPSGEIIQRMLGGGGASTRDAVDAGYGDIVAAARPSAEASVLTPHPLPGSTQAMMREHLGHDFGAVRIHRDAQAGAAATAIGAAAFTVGNDIAFAPGRYQPGTPDGQHLLAHELAHVAQGAAAASPGAPAHAELGGEQDPEERSADAAARLVAWGVRLPPGALASGQPRVRRAPETWFRGEAIGVPPARPGAWLHDLGEGLYLTDSAEVAERYAVLRGKENNAAHRVVSVSVERRELGRVLDLNKDARWQKLIKQRIGNITFEDTLKISENYARAFEGFLQHEGIERGQYDAVIGREYVRGGNQLCVWNDDVAKQIRARANPVTAAEIGARTTAAKTAAESGHAPAPETKPGAPPAPDPAHKPPAEVPAAKPGAAPPKRGPTAATKAPETAATTAETAAATAEGSTAAKATTAKTTTAQTPKTLGRTAAMEAENVAQTVSRARRLLRGFGKAAETLFSLKVQVPLAALLEIINAVEMINMSMSALAGEGFVLTQNIAQARTVRGEVARALNWYAEGYRADLHSALTDINMMILLAHSPEARDAVRREAPGILASLRAFDATWAPLLARVRAIKNEAETKHQIADKLLRSKEFYQLTGFSGTAIAATVLGISEDLTTISGTLGSAETDLSQLLDMVREDIASMQFYL